MPNLPPDILITKVTPPYLRTPIIHRERLLERLAFSPEMRLLLVSGPAGYGKTTLLADWQQTQLHKGVSSGWLSLDSSNNEPHRFLRYLSAAIQISLGNDIQTANALELISFASAQNMEGAMTILINSISQFQGTFLLIIDDYHVIVNPAVHHALGFLLDNLPVCLKVAIGTRADPPLPIARLRSRGQLVEIRMGDLRFSQIEANHFLTSTLHLNLSASDLASLQKLTEGWAAGLQLCGLSLQNWPEWTEKLLNDATQHRPVMEYLGEEVFQLLPWQIQTFLLSTCLLDELNIELCAAVLQNPQEGSRAANPLEPAMDCGSMVEWLFHANLFVIPLDPHGKSFRYHALFAEFLQDHLARSHPDWVENIHKRASEWYWQQNNTDQAVRYAIKSGDLNWLVHLIEQSAVLMLVRSELSILKEWLAHVPSEILRANPFLLVISGWNALLLGELKQVEPNLCAAELALEAQSWPALVDLIGYSVTPQILRCHILALRAFAARIGMDWETAIHLSQQALDQLPPSEQVVRSTLILNLGQVYKETFQVELCRQILTETVETGKISGNLYIQLTALVVLGIQAVLQGRMDEAKSYYFQALTLGYRKDGSIVLPAVSFAEAWLGDWYFMQNQLEEAQVHLDRAIQLAEFCGEYGILHDAYTNRVKLALAVNDMPAAQKFTDKAEAINLEGIPASREWIEAQKMLVWLAQGKIQDALAWAVRTPFLVSPQQITRSSEKRMLSAVRVTLEAAKAGLADGPQIRRCLDSIELLLAAAQTSQRTASVVELLLLKAGFLQISGDGSGARDCMRSAHRLADPIGWKRIFLDAPVKIDLQSSRMDEISTLAEALSERELELVRMMAEGASNEEISRRLFITVGTVKSHLNHIFSKLGVRNRTEAAARARILKLV